MGPIMPSFYPSLDDTTARFLDVYKEVVYVVSFGQHASLTPESVAKVQLRSSNSIRNCAAMVEEVSFTSDKDNLRT
jgi:hypothetical protein